MNKYEVAQISGHNERIITVVLADGMSSNMAGVLFFHRKTGKIKKCTLPESLGGGDEEVTETTDVFAPGAWIEARKK